jgi:hypothetical protein
MSGGGSNSQLVLCEDGRLYVVKTVGNPQGTRILANEFVAWRLAEILGAPCPPCSLVEVRESESGQTGLPVGVHFGSSFVSGSDGVALNDPPLEIASRFVNLEDLPAVIVFDTLVANEDRKGAHILFHLVGEPQADPRYRFWIIDHGHCLGVTRGWTGLRAPGRGVVSIFPQLISGNDPFRSTLARLAEITGPKVRSCLDEIPLEPWGVPDSDRESLVAYLLEQRDAIPRLLEQARLSFPNWSR